MRRSLVFSASAALSVSALAILLSCGGPASRTAASNSAAMINLTVSDPATCSAPQGPFSHVFVTIVDVKINASSTAGDQDPGWTDLTPNLAQNPQQVDLLGQANNQCFLATLGDPQQLQAGTYQQIRLILADNSATVANNA